MEKFFNALSSEIICQVKNEVSVFPHYHRHDGYEIFILLKGNVNYYIEQHSYHLSSGSMVLINPEEYHRAELISNTVYERIVLNVRTAYLDLLSTEHTDLSLCFLNRPVSEKNLIQLSTQDLQSFLLISKNLEKMLGGGYFLWPGFAYYFLYAADSGKNQSIISGI